MIPFIFYISVSLPVEDAAFSAHIVTPLMPMPRIWIKHEGANVLQLGFLIETHVVASYEEDLRLSACWWPYGRSLLSTKLQVIVAMFSIYS